MKIAFYAPLKSPLHPVASGDRLMAQLLFRALELGGHQVELASELRSFSAEPPLGQTLLDEAEAEQLRLSRRFARSGAPDLWFCYHPYYKAPDLLGPALSRTFGMRYVTVEASWSARRERQGWGARQELVLAAIREASLNICMTRRDRDGLLEIAPEARTASLPPFIDTAIFAAIEPRPLPGALVTVAMMRPGDKLDSYRMLAAALRPLQGDWHLHILGDGPARAEVEALFTGLPEGRIVFAGARSQAEVAEALARASLFVWPGCGEAYGLAYLEAQAAGVPVLATATAGVPEVVINGTGGVLTPAGDRDAYAEALAGLLADHLRLEGLARSARRFALEERSLPAAATRLSALLETLKGTAA